MKTARENSEKGERDFSQFFFFPVDVPEESFYFKVCDTISFTILYFYAGTGTL